MAKPPPGTTPKKAPTPGAPTAVAHQKRGGAGAGPHRDKKRDEEQVPRKRKHKGRGLESEPE
jgi:hypothetical protein